MDTQIIHAAVSIVDPPTPNDQFTGTRAEALRAMVEWAAEIHAEHQGNAQVRVTEALRNSQPDRVAEVAAFALLELTNTL